MLCGEVITVQLSHTTFTTIPVAGLRAGSASFGAIPVPSWLTNTFNATLLFFLRTHLVLRGSFAAFAAPCVRAALRFYCIACLCCATPFYLPLFLFLGGWFLWCVAFVMLPPTIIYSTPQHPIPHTLTAAWRTLQRLTLALPHRTHTAHPHCPCPPHAFPPHSPTRPRGRVFKHATAASSAYIRQQPPPRHCPGTGSFPPPPPPPSNPTGSWRALPRTIFSVLYSLMALPLTPCSGAVALLRAWWHAARTHIRDLLCTHICTAH